MKACLFALLFGGLLAAQAPPANLTVPATASLDGDVVDEEGRAIAAAGIELRGVGLFLNTTSDAGGHFQFTGLRGGQYVLEAGRPGFLRLNARQIAVKPGEGVAGIRVTLKRQAVISGKVTDDGGWPAANARVRALRYETWEGTRQLRTVASDAVADDLGRYRLAHLPAGRYYVLAAPGWNLINWDQRNGPTYYPATVEASEARLVTVEAGKETGGIDIKVMRVEGVQISGRVVGPSGTPLGSEVPMSIVSGDTTVQSGPQFTQSARDGSFRFRHVHPGPYSLRAGVSSSPGYSTLAESALGAQQRLVVADRDIAGVELALRPLAFEVSGKVTFDGKTEPSLATVFLNGTNGRSFFVKADGAFVIKGVMPARYWVSAWMNGAYASSVRFGGKEVSSYLELDGSSAGPLEITMRSGGAKVEGVVSDATGAPVQQALVVLVGQIVPPRLRRTAIPVDQFGRFSATYLVPGEYTILAVGDSNLVKVADDPEFQKANANSIKNVTLVEGANPSLSLVMATQ